MKKRRSSDQIALHYASLKLTKDKTPAQKAADKKRREDKKKK